MSSNKRNQKVASKSKKAVKTVPATKTASVKTTPIETKDVPKAPFREGSDYKLIYDCLYRMSQKHEVIRREDLLNEVVRVSGNKSKRIRFSYSMAVVLSPRKDGSAHKSAKKACDRCYYILPKENGMIQLIHR